MVDTLDPSFLTSWDADLSRFVPLESQGPITEITGLVKAPPMGYFFEVAEQYIVAYFILNQVLFRVQVMRTGTYQSTMVPLRELLRVEESLSATSFTLLIEFTASVKTIAVAAYLDKIPDSVEENNYYRAQGTITPDGYVLTAANSTNPDGTVNPGYRQLVGLAATLRYSLLSYTR